MWKPANVHIWEACWNQTSSWRCNYCRRGGFYRATFNVMDKIIALFSIKTKTPRKSCLYTDWCHVPSAFKAIYSMCFSLILIFGGLCPNKNSSHLRSAESRKQEPLLSASPPSFDPQTETFSTAAAFLFSVFRRLKYLSVREPVLNFSCFILMKSGSLHLCLPWWYI